MLWDFMHIYKNMHNRHFCFDLLLTNRYGCAIIQMYRLDSCNLRYSVKLALHKAVGNDGKSDTGKNDIKDTCISAGVAAYLVYLLTLLVHPVKCVDAQGEKRVDKCRSAACSLGGSAGIKFVCELYEPKDAVDTARD